MQGVFCVPRVTNTILLEARTHVLRELRVPLCLSLFCMPAFLFESTVGSLRMLMRGWASVGGGGLGPVALVVDCLWSGHRQALRRSMTPWAASALPRRFGGFGRGQAAWIWPV